jgi:hypothetical protein
MSIQDLIKKYRGDKKTPATQDYVSRNTSTLENRMAGNDKSYTYSPAYKPPVQQETAPKQSSVSDLMNTFQSTKAPRTIDRMLSETEENKKPNLLSWIANTGLKGVINPVKGLISSAETMRNVEDQNLSDLSKAIKYGGKLKAPDVTGDLNKVVQMIDKSTGYNNMGKTAKFMGDTISSIPQTAMNMIPGYGQALFGISAAGNYADEARQQGADPTKQALYGITGGVAEVGLNNILGVVPGYKKLFGEAFGDDIAKYAGQKGAKRVLNIGKEYLKNAAREAMEEAAIDPVMGLANKALIDPDKKWLGEGGVVDPKQIGTDALSGAVMGGLMESPAFAYETAVKPGVVAKQGEIASLKEQAKPMIQQLGLFNDDADLDAYAEYTARRAYNAQHDKLSGVKNTLEKSGLVKDAEHAVMGGKWGDLQRAARQNPEDAIKYVLFKDFVNVSTNRYEMEDEGVRTQVSDLQKQLGEDTAATNNMPNIIEASNVPTEVEQEVMEEVPNSELLNGKRMNLQHQVIPKLQAQYDSLLQQIDMAQADGMDENTLASMKARAGIFKSQMDDVVTQNYTPSMRFKEQLQNTGVDTSYLEGDAIIEDPMQSASHSIDQTAALVKSLANANGRPMGDADALNIAMRIKQAADNVINTFNTTYPELRGRYTGTTNVSPSELVNGAVNPAEKLSPVAMQQTIEGQEKPIYDIQEPAMTPFDLANQRNQINRMQKSNQGMVDMKNQMVDDFDQFLKGAGLKQEANQDNPIKKYIKDPVEYADEKLKERLIKQIPDLYKQLGQPVTDEKLKQIQGLPTDKIQQGVNAMKKRIESLPKKPVHSQQMENNLRSALNSYNQTLRRSVEQSTDPEAKRTMYYKSIKNYRLEEMTDEQIQNAIKELNEKKQMIGANGTTNSSLSENSIKAIQQVLARDYSMHLSVEQIKKMSRTNLNRLYNDVVNGVMPTDKELLEYLTPEEQIQNTRDLNLVKNDEGTPNKVIDNKVIDTRAHMSPSSILSDMKEVAVDTDDLSNKIMKALVSDPSGESVELAQEVLKKAQSGEPVIAKEYNDAMKALRQYDEEDMTTSKASYTFSEKAAKAMDNMLKKLHYINPNAEQAARKYLKSNPITSAEQQQKVFDRIKYYMDGEDVNAFAKGNSSNFLETPEDSIELLNATTKKGNMRIDATANPESVRNVIGIRKGQSGEADTLSKQGNTNIINGEMGSNIAFEKNKDVTFLDKQNPDEFVSGHEGGHVMQEFNSRKDVSDFHKAVQSSLQNASDEDIASASKILKDEIALDVDLKSGFVTEYGKSKGTHKENTADIAGLLTHSNPAVRQAIEKVLSPEAKTMFYDMLKNVPEKDIQLLVPKTTTARQEAVDKLKKMQDIIKVVDRQIKETKDMERRAGSIKNQIDEYNRLMNPDNEKELMDWMKTYYPNVPVTRLEPTMKMVKGLTADLSGSLKDNQKEALQQIKDTFLKWGMEEGIINSENQDEMQDFAEHYVPHVLNWDLRKNKAAQAAYQGLNLDPTNMNAQQRKYQDTIKNINEKMAEKHPEFGDNFFETNILKIFSERALKHNKFMFEKNVIDKALGLFGERIDRETFLEMPGELRKAKAQSIREKAATGDYVVVRLDDKYEKRLVNTISPEGLDDAEVRHAMEQTEGNDTPFLMVDPKDISAETLYEKLNTPVYLMPKSAYDAMNRAVVGQFKRTTNQWVKAWDKVNSLMKRNMLLTPGYHMTNAIGNVFNSYLGIGANILNPSLYIGAAKIQAGKGTVMGKPVQYWIDSLKKYGMLDSGAFTGDLEQFRRSDEELLKKPKMNLNPLSNNFAVYKGNQKIGTKIEDQSRIVNFLYHVKNGKSMQEAADLTNKFLFDYSDITDFEQNGIKRWVAPFYTWFRKNLPLQATQLLKQPLKYAAVYALMRAVSAPEDDEQKKYKPDYLKNAIHLGDNRYVNINLPMYDLQKATPRDLWSMANPIWKMAFELPANKNVYFGSEIGRPGETAKAPAYLRPFAKDTPNGKMVDAKLRYAMQNLFPSIENLSNIYDVATGNGTATQESKVSGLKTGFRVYEPDIEKAKTAEAQANLDSLTNQDLNLRQEGYYQKSAPVTETKSDMQKLIDKYKNKR